MKAGILIRKFSIWVGLHYSPTNKRFCINLIPFITIWIIQKEGLEPLNTIKLPTPLTLILISTIAMILSLFIIPIFHTLAILIAVIGITTLMIGLITINNNYLNLKK